MDSLTPSSVKNPSNKMKARKTSYKGDAAARNSTGSSRQTEPGSLPSSRKYSSSGFGKDESYYYCSAQGCSKTFNSLEEVQSHMRNHQMKSSSNSKNPQQRYSARLRARSIRISDEKKQKESEAAEAAAEAQAAASTSAGPRPTTTVAAEDTKAGRKRALEVEPPTNVKVSKKAGGNAKTEAEKAVIPEGDHDDKAAAVAQVTAEEPQEPVAAPPATSAAAAAKASSRATRLNRNAKFTGDCPICARTYLTKSGLWMHLTAYKTCELKCVQCSLDFDKHESLMFHVCHVHAVNKPAAASESTAATPTTTTAAAAAAAVTTTTTDTAAAATTDAAATASSTAEPETPLQATLKSNHAASAIVGSVIGDTSNKEVNDMDCGGEDKQQQGGGEEAAIESSGDQSVDGGSSVPSPPSTIASTGTSNNEPPRSTSASTVNNNNRPASKRFKKADYRHGFGDLADHDFSSDGFTAVAEMVCTKNPHLLMERDGLYCFHCRLCDFMYPCLNVLDQHFVRRHPEYIPDIEAIKAGKTLAPKEQEEEHAQVNGNDEGAAASTEVPEPQEGTAATPTQVPEPQEGAAEEKMSVDETADNQKSEEKTAAAVDDDDEASEIGVEETVGAPYNPDDPNSEPSDDFLQMLGLKRREDPAEKAARLAREKKPETAGITYGMDNEFVFTSPAPGFHKQPSWMRSKDSGSIVIPDKRYISPNATNGSAASQSNTNHMLQVYGIQISTGRNGKKTYWCRICDYNSFEKSTILRDCNYSFTTKANCERHIKKRHADVLQREKCDAKSLVVANDEQIKRLREGGYGLRDPNFAPNITNGRQRHRPYSSKCLVCLKIFSAHSDCVRHLVREHGIAEDRATENLMNILPSTAGTPISTSPTDTAQQYHSAGESDERMDYQSGASSPVASNNDTSREQLENYFDSFLQQPGDEAGNKDHEGEQDDVWKRRTLTPLSKIQAFNEAATKMREYFERDYHSVLAAFNVNSSGSNGVQPVQMIKSKLLSLLTSTSHQINARNRNKRGGSARTSAGGAASNSQHPHHPTAAGPTVLVRSAGVPSTSALYAAAAARPLHTSLKRPFPGPKQQQQQRDSSFRPIKPKRKRGDPSSSMVDSPGTSTGMTRDQLIDICNESHDAGEDSDPHWNIARGYLCNTKPKFVKPKKTIPLETKLPHFSSSGYQSLPTMVEMNNKFGAAATTNGEAGGSSGRDVSDRRLQPPRKCPKCTKSFPWSSSLRRHIMTHTGLKPYMCSHCGMRFTTRSNLLRHAYRRHDVERNNSNERQNVVVNLPLTEQQRFAEEEARSIEEDNNHLEVSTEEQEHNAENAETSAEHGESSNAGALSLIENSLVDHSYDDSIAASQSGGSEMFDGTPNYSSMFEPATVSTNAERASSTPIQPQTSSFNTSAKIKKYLCGKCNVPFANRSNVVRHLSKQHNITKDHRIFKSLLVKIDGSFVMERRPNRNHLSKDSPSLVTNASLFDTHNDVTGGSRALAILNSPASRVEPTTPVSAQKRKLSVTAVSSTPVPPAKITVISTSAPVLKTEPPTTAVVLPASARYSAQKEFKCTICNMGFTKRNNAARHVQQQHQIKQRGLGKSGFVVRIDDHGDEIEAPNTSSAMSAAGSSTAPSTPARDAAASSDVANDNESMCSNDSIAETATTTPAAAEQQPRRPRLVTRIKVPPGMAASSSKAGSNKSDQKNDSAKSYRSFAKAKESVVPTAAAAAGVVEVAARKKKITNPFSCGFCKRIFENVDKLKEHIVVHQTPHPWECPLCSTPFTSKYNCQRHLGRRHSRLDLTPLFVGENEPVDATDDEVLDLSTYSSSSSSNMPPFIAAAGIASEQQN